MFADKYIEQINHFSVRATLRTRASYLDLFVLIMFGEEYKFGILTAMKMFSVVFQTVTPCILVGEGQCL